MTSYENVISRVSQQMAEIRKPVERDNATTPQMKENNEDKSSSLMNTIGLAINREGGMNV